MQAALSDSYSHRYHAGNVGDVWKHCALTAFLAPLVLPEAPPLWVIETHAGEGSYRLGPTGEWTEGVGKVWAGLPGPQPEAVRRYLDLLATLARPDATGRRYPGSPAFTRELLRPQDRLLLHELQPEDHATLARTLGADPRIEAISGDGLAALPERLRTAPADAEVVVLIDPPYTAKPDWHTIPDALLAAWRQRPTARLILWYPVKSYTRPNAMLQRLQAAGLPATTLELITTPLQLQRNRLNGSGMLMVNPPPGVLAAVAAAAPTLGLACATHAGAWSSRMLALGREPT